LGLSDEALADGTAFPRRFGVFFWGNGTLPHRWTPVGEGLGDEWQLSDQLQPLASIKEHLTVVSGLEVRVPNVIPHFSGAAGFMCGVAPLGEEGDNTVAGPTIDQIIAAELGGETLYRSLEIGGRPGGGGGISYTGPHSVNPAERSPFAFFERLFGVGFTPPGEEAVVDPSLALRRSVLDAVSSRMSALKQRVSQQDRQRLQQHEDGIRDLELRLARMQANPISLASCARPDQPDDDGSFGDDVLLRHQALCDLLAMALACDQTRVFTDVLTKPVSNYLFPGMESGHHRLTHDEPDPQPQVHECVLFCMQQYRYLVEALQAIPEGEGTLLDHCIVLGTSGVSLGRTHALDEFPILYAGSGGGVLKTGMHYRSHTRENASAVLLTCMRSLGMLRSEFGVDDARVTDGLSVLEL
tara:strand:- start:5230 stop:6465 length:1236 start_codon:yes stop_codon:yes gene_type:complete